MERTPRQRDELATNMQVDKSTVQTDVVRTGENGEKKETRSLSTGLRGLDGLKTQHVLLAR